MTSVLRYFLWVVVATLWAMICFLLPDFLDNPMGDIRTMLIISCYIVALGIANFWIIYLIGLYRVVAFVLLPIYGLLGAVVSFYRVAYHATITPMIIESVLATNSDEMASVISLSLCGWIIINLCIVGLLLWWRNHLLAPNRRWLHALIIIILMSGYYWGNGRLHASINQRYPYNVVYNSFVYGQMRKDAQAPRQMPQVEIGLPEDSLQVVLVLGEAMRADHLSMNGYLRMTTPKMSKQSNVVSLPHIYSEYTHTAASLPHILTDADSVHTEWINTHHSLVAVMDACGYKTYWMGNQDAVRTFAPFINEADTVIYANAGKSVFVFHPWYDDQLVSLLKNHLQEDEPSLFVLHTIGSHWYYNNHVPVEYQQYQPVTDNRVVLENTVEQVVNSYDNTALYMDVVLDSLCTVLADKKAIIIYLSDHGESLGENGNWLHANGAEETHYPACLVWWSDRYERAFPEKITALKANHTKRYRTDFLFHSLLSAAGQEPLKQKEELNIFSN